MVGVVQVQLEELVVLVQNNTHSEAALIGTERFPVVYLFFLVKYRKDNVQP